MIFRHDPWPPLRSCSSIFNLAKLAFFVVLDDPARRRLVDKQYGGRTRPGPMADRLLLVTPTRWAP